MILTAGLRGRSLIGRLPRARPSADFCFPGWSALPYLFLKPTDGAIIGNGDPVVIPYGRDRIDGDVELAIVMSRAARYVPATKAQDYVFGYMVSIDLSFPGDVINNGTSGGTGAGTVYRGEPRFLKPGEEMVATIEGIGTLRLPVTAGKVPPEGTGLVDDGLEPGSAAA